MSNEIAVRQQTALPANDHDNFWGAMETTDFAIPMVTIGQPTSAKGESGKFNYNNGFSTTSIEGCVLIVPHKTRVLYGGRNQKSRCSSDNFYTPSARVTNPISSNCQTCYAADWGDDDPRKAELARDLNSLVKGRNPLCKETYNLLMADGNMSPFFIKFQSSMLKVVSEKLFSRLRFQYSGKAPHSVAFDMKLKKVENNKGVYYDIVFDNFRPLSPEAALKTAEMYAQHSKSAKQVLADQHAQLDAQAETVVETTDEPAPWPTSDDEIPF